MSDLILTALGTSLLTETSYYLGDRAHSSRFCSLALSRTLESPVNLLLALLTTAASEKHRKHLIDEAAALGVTCEILDISEGKTIDEVWSVFDRIIQRLSTAVTPHRVFLDITNSFRHLPLLFFASLSYLEATHKAELGGIFYGAYENRDQIANRTPIFDLSPLTALVKGSFAVKTFMETGGVETLGEFLQEMPGFDERAGRHFDKKLKEYHPMQASGLSLEAGNHAQALLEMFPSLITENNQFVAGRELAEKLRGSLEKVALRKGSGAWKKGLILDHAELERQLNFIEDKLVQHDTAQALMLLREWVINRIWLSMKPEGEWLASRDRQTMIENRLYRASLVIDKNIFPAGLLYKLLGDRRNEFAHAGFRKDNVKVGDRLNLAREKFDICREHLHDDAWWIIPELPKTSGKLLVSGLGSSAGLLYTALRLTAPDRAVILTSSQAQERIPEICDRAGVVTPDKFETRLLKEVFTGFDETAALVKNIEPHLLGASEIVINLTGGTTCMQWVMQAVYERARELGLPVRRVAFVDRRPTVEQQQNPFVLGELIEIDQ
ncbi:MAG TPA: TM1812 family CRISPR-associated protein [Candidatus Ozemobacteraceae bacterium]|nr:TM1812 family CRISPR-associated protein [Candidatus Ozemobacteraceae bacterium]